MNFKERNVVVLIRSRPFGKILNFEGWRAAVGMFGMDHHSALLFMGDGVYSLLKGIDQTPIKMFKSTYESFDGRIHVSAKSLEARGIAASELFDDVVVLDEKGVASLLGESEIVVSF